MSLPAREALRVDRHIEFLGVLHLLWAAFNAVVGVAMACFAASALLLAGSAPRTRPGADIAAGVTAGGFLIVAVTGLVWAGVHAWCGRGLRRRDGWARAVALVLALLNLLLFPFGTLLAGYAFWVLLQDDVRVRFERADARANG
jgi:hypothetical protein